MNNLWENQLRLQLEVSKNLDLHVLKNIPGFKKAQAVLELGSGDGGYLSLLAENFPEKAFHGVDISPEMVQLAQEKAKSRRNLSFELADLFELEHDIAPFDFIIVRLVVQHLKDLDGFMKIASGLLQKDGMLLVIEPADDLVQMNPEVPSVSRLLDRIRAGQPAGGPKKALKVLKKSAKKAGMRWLVDNVGIEKVKGIRRDLASRVWKNLAKLAPTAFSIPEDPQIEQELDAWRILPQAEFSYALRFVLFQKK